MTPAGAVTGTHPSGESVRIVNTDGVWRINGGADWHPTLDGCKEEVRQSYLRRIWPQRDKRRWRWVQEPT